MDGAGSSVWEAGRDTSDITHYMCYIKELELQIRQFSQSRRRPLLGPSAGWKRLPEFGVNIRLA